MSRGSFGTTAAVLAAATLWYAPATRAGSDEDEKIAAVAHHLSGKQLMEDGRYEEAIEEFAAAFETVEAPLALFYMAGCHAELGRSVEALSLYKRFLGLTMEDSYPRLPVDGYDSMKAKIKKAGKKMNELLDEVGELEIVVDEEGVEVLVDGTRRGTTPLEPLVLGVGEHAVVLKKDGFVQVDEPVTIEPGDTTRLEVALEAEDPPPAAEQEPGQAAEEQEVEDRQEDAEDEEEDEEETEDGQAGAPTADGREKLSTIPFIATASAAGALLAGSLVTGILAIEAHDEFSSQTRDDEDGWRPLKKRTENLALATDVLLGVGGACAAAAVVLVFFTDFGKERAGDIALAPVLTSRVLGLGVSGEF
jgi:tetratricopeptide (TPR) repeat protein